MKELCETKQSLWREWQDATDVYAKAVATLTSRIGKFQEPEYSELRRRVAVARQLAEQTQKDLELHLAVHGC